MKEPEIEEEPISEIYYDYDYDEEVKKEIEKKNKKKIKTSGCPVGYEKNKHGQCLSPEVMKLNKKMKMLEEQADMLEQAWKDAVDFSTGRIPMQGEGKRLNLIDKLLDENIEDLKSIKRYLFW